MIPSEEKCVVHMVQNKLKDLFGWINNYVLGVRRLNLTCRVPLSIRRDLHIIEERVKLVGHLLCIKIRSCIRLHIPDRSMVMIIVLKIALSSSHCFSIAQYLWNDCYCMAVITQNI